MCYSIRMDIYETRKSRVETLLTRFKTQKALADAIGREPAYVSFILSSNPTYKKKIGEDLARAIEQKIGLDVGWLDRAEGDVGELELLVEGYKRSGGAKRSAMTDLAGLPEEAAAILAPIIAAMKEKNDNK